MVKVLEAGSAITAWDVTEPLGQSDVKTGVEVTKEPGVGW